MKFFVKDKDGNSVEATQAQVLSPDVLLFNEKGEAINRQQSAAKDPIAELTDVVKDLAVNVSGLSGIKDKTEELEQKIEAYNVAAQKGFPLPIPDGGMSGEEGKELFAPYDMAKQGKSLMDKFHHPRHVIDLDRKNYIAEYFVLFLKSAYHGIPAAREEFVKRYGSAIVDSTQKTAIGDTGNVFPVPDILDEEILAFAREKSAVLQYARIWDMISDKQSFPKESSGASVAWGSTTSEGTPTVTEFELDAEELSSYAPVRNATLMDTRSDIVSWLTEALAEAAGQEIDNSAFNGDGTSTYGYCSGILSAACGNTVTLGAGDTSIADIDADDYSSMIAQLDGLKKQGARFWMNGALLHYVRILKDSQDRPIFIETIGTSVPGMIYGYPYTEVVKMPSTDAANSPFVAFGNMRYFGVGRRLAVTTLSVDPYGLFLENKTRFKLYQRWGIDMALSDGFVRMLTHS